METLREQQQAARIQELEERIVKLETNFSYMTKNTNEAFRILKELQRFFIALATEHRVIQQHVKSWPFVKVYPQK